MKKRFLISLTAVCLSMSFVPVMAESTESGDVMTFEEYNAAAVDDPVTIETYVQAAQIMKDGAVSLYAQDEDGACFIYALPISEEEYARLVPGTKIQVSGYKGEWSGEPELVDGEGLTILEGSYIAEPLDVTDLLGTDELNAHKNELVSFKGLTVVSSGKNDDGEEVAFFYNWDNSGTEGNDLYFKVEKDGEEYSFVVESDLCDADSEVYKAVKELEIGDVIDLEGFLYWYEGPNPHITAISKSEE